ncbi:MAG: hypothetical protein MUC36_24015 [Planctomycetes bacterium]|jgi:hypothetical protein|nr:hypothetical protein [Planctomycetota bacterium]
MNAILFLTSAVLGSVLGCLGSEADSVRGTCAGLRSCEVIVALPAGVTLVGAKTDGKCKCIEETCYSKSCSYDIHFDVTLPLGTSGYPFRLGPPPLDGGPPPAHPTLPCQPGGVVMSSPQFANKYCGAPMDSILFAIFTGQGCIPGAGGRPAQVLAAGISCALDKCGSGTCP